jgi:hypothetical protein
MKHSFFLLCSLLCFAIPIRHYAGNKYSVKSGQWNDASLWSPAGLPASNDDVHIMTGHLVTVSSGSYTSRSIQIKKNATLQLSIGAVLNIKTLLKVDGEVNMNNGDINADVGSQFILSDSAVFQWEPGSNSAAGAALFNHAIEDFSPTSYLIIKKWYDYSIPLATDITGDLGNVELHSYSNNVIFEWNQNNLFASHRILGTLTIGRAWITLDKSGAMDSVFIKRIKLENTNSYLDFHGGNHPSGFTLVTDEIYNYGGEINGIYNGNGNIKIVVNGNVTNYGNIVLIRNTGLFGTGNGNASLQVAGTFTQHTGDFRGIFNLTTFQAGITQLRFNDLKLLGGIFLSQYACHTGSGINRFEVMGNLEIHFNNAQNKFRVSGLTSLAGTINKAGTEIIIHGNTTVNGHQQAEFTSSGASGFESVYTGGQFEVNGCSVHFNAGNHPSTLSFNQNVVMNNGNLSFNQTKGDATVAILKNFFVNGGTVALKENSGNATFIISGDYLQAGGWFLLFSNTSESSASPIQMNVQGSFIQTGGQMNLCNNPASLQPITISLESPEIILNGNGIITRSGNSFGKMMFARQGDLSFKRLSNAHQISQLKLSVENSCTLKLAAGNLQISSSQTKATDMLVVKSGGVLQAGESKIFSNMLNQFSGIKVENNGRLSLMNADGFFNGTETGCLNAAGGMDYELEPLSIVEYCGIENQIITGHSNVALPTDHHKYGILEINFKGNTTKKVSIGDKVVAVRTRLKLLQGELRLAGNTLQVESGSADAIQVENGFISSQPSTSVHGGYLSWNNLSTGIHTIPFGISKDELLPFTFNLKSGAGKSIKVATQSVNEYNLPYPNANPAITGIIRNGMDVSVTDVIDRYYEIIAADIKADVDVSYTAGENTLTTSGNRLAIQAWKNGKWSDSFGYGLLAAGGGTVSAKEVTQFGVWIIATPFNQPAGPFLSFDVSNEQAQVTLHWELTPGIVIPESFQIQRSFNGSPYTTVKEHKPASSTIATFEDGDELAEEGEYQYRIAFKQANASVYSEWRTIIYRDNANQAVEIAVVKPNPFRNFFEAGFQVPDDGPAEIRLVNQAGQIAAKESIHAMKGLNYFKFYDKDNLRSGLYVLTLSYSNVTKTVKLFKTE